MNNITRRGECICMDKSIIAIRRESVKYECIANQAEGDERRLSLAKAITYEAIAAILEDPEKRAELFRVATGKPRLRLVGKMPFEQGSSLINLSDRASVLLESLWLGRLD